MSTNPIEASDLESLLRRAGEDWRRQPSRPLTQAEQKAVDLALDGAFRKIAAAKKASLREQLGALLRIPGDWLHSTGVLSPSWLTLREAAAFSEVPETRVDMSMSSDSRLKGSLEVTADHELYVSFETRDPALADAEVAYALVKSGNAEPLVVGRILLVETQSEETSWGNRTFVGSSRDLQLSEDHELIFGVTQRTELP